MNTAALRKFATDYTAAWCSQDAASVAEFFAPEGFLQINDAPAAVGRKAITQAAQEFMTDFPDMIVLMDDLRPDQSPIIYHWTLIGTNTGPGGLGNPVRISGYEEWIMSPDGLIAESFGHFDAAEYRRQLTAGAAGPEA